MSDNAWVGIFPLFFMGMWLLGGVFVYVMSGWSNLLIQFPDRLDQPIQRLRFQSGMTGNGSIWNPWGGVRFGRCLRLDLCKGGLRVATWRIFFPFCKPFYVPWELIQVEERQTWFLRSCCLSFGTEKSNALTIYNGTFQRIAASGLLKTGQIS